MIIDLSAGIEQTNPLPYVGTLEGAQPYEVFEGRGGHWMWKDSYGHVMFYNPTTGYIAYADDKPDAWPVVRYVGQLGKKS